jgi:hypothetical protein
MSLSLNQIQSDLQDIQQAPTLAQARAIAARLSRRLAALRATSQEWNDEFTAYNGVDRFYPGYYDFDGYPDGWTRFSRLPHETQEQLLRSWGAPQSEINRTTDALPNALYQLYQRYHQ